MFGWVLYDEFHQCPVRRFKRCGVWVPKKSKKSPTMAGIAVHLLCGDGEPGAKVFLGGKDGKQLRQNAALHIVNMIEQSPELSSECKVNHSEMSVAHPATRSLLTPLSSSNAQSQKSKEGLNGSLLVDETHVVDREFMDRVTRMGISRREPLIGQFSTAGDDPDSYGKEECDKGLDVNAGRIDDDRYLCVIYAAPQDLTDNDLADDPERYIRMANPAIGHTINIREALDDYRQSVGTDRRARQVQDVPAQPLAAIGQPWIRGNDWAKCRRDFTAADLQGLVCGAGLDLGKTDDMSARYLWFFRKIRTPGWSCAGVQAGDRGQRRTGRAGRQRSGSRQAHHGADRATGEAAHVLLAPGGVGRKVPRRCDLQAMACRRLAPYLSRRHRRFDADHRGDSQGPALYQVKMFGYDPWYAAPILSVLMGQNLLPEEYTWKFSQTIQNYAWPATLLERLILAGNLHHDGNPITVWEMGHVQAKEDNNGNVRPVKPKRGNGKKIDGVVSAVMGLDAATRLAVNISVYETRSTQPLGGD